MGEDKIDSHLWDVMHKYSGNTVMAPSYVHSSSSSGSLIALVEFYDEGNLNQYKNAVEFAGATILSKDRLQPILRVQASEEAISRISMIAGVAKIWYDARAKEM